MKGWKSGEGAAAKLLQAWWGVPFFRTPESGGMATSRHGSLPPSVVSNLVGDLVCDLRDPQLDPSVSFPFVVEVKCYNTIDLYALPRRGAFSIQPGAKPSTESDLWLCWYQAKVEAYRGNRWPLLLFKEDRKQWYVAFKLSALMGEVLPFKDVLIFGDMGIMSWERFVERFPRDCVEGITASAISEGKLKPPERWADPVDLNVPIEIITGFSPK